MAGPVEEGAKVATGVIESLKGQPIILSLVLFNVLFMGAVAWGTAEARRDFTKTISLLIEKQDKTAEMLYRCTPTPGNKTNLPGELHLDLLSNPYLDKEGK
jgi:hypothetical protein